MSGIPSKPEPPARFPRPSRARAAGVLGYLRESGRHSAAKSIVNEVLRKTQKEQPEARAKIEELEAIMNGFKAVIGKDIVVTTHAMFCNLKEEDLKQFDCVIIDEDIKVKGNFLKKL